MQHFVDGFVAQCIRHDLPAELILVEWNPPRDRAPLIEELRWPTTLGPCSIRLITVPAELHSTLEHSEKLPLFQMIAKNVGIRRARGKFVLATNIDILFSDEIFSFLKTKLQENALYRADRWDIPHDVPSDVPFDQVLQFCWEQAFRINTNGYTATKNKGRWPAGELQLARMSPRQRYLRRSFQQTSMLVC